MKQQRLPSASGHLLGEQGAPVVFVTGPPAAAALFRVVQSRLGPRNTAALDLNVPDVPSAELLPALAEGLAESMAELGARVVVAHGLAVPVALYMPPEAADLVLVCNGPISRPDPVTRALARLPEAAIRKVLLHPKIFARWLSSSAGLRRTVTNPYAMHRDIVVMLSERWTRDELSRAEAARWLRAAALPVGSYNMPPNKVVAIWGDHDPLYPLSEAQRLDGAEVIRVPGGRFFFIEERPWTLADTLSEVLPRRS